MPPAGKAPVITIDTSTFGEKLASMYNNSSMADVVFRSQEGDRELHAHACLLASASLLFGGLFCEDKALPSVFKSISWDDGHSKAELIVDEDVIPFDVFEEVLFFLYSGALRSSALADTKDKDARKERAEKLSTAARLFDMDMLSSFVENITNSQEELNPSISTWLNDALG
jgi:BTB/POZ domain